jgi:hypothetical protein
MTDTDDVVCKLWIMETNHVSSGYIHRFENIKTLTLVKNGVVLELNAEEAEQLYKHLKPKIAG